MPTFGILFAGIGGIDLGLERAGWICRWQVEYEPFCQHVLEHHWPDVRRYGDIRDVDWSGVEPVDLIAGGFPCQPVSAAGKQAAQDDPRWLWPEFRRAIRDLRPRLVLVENVRALLSVNRGTAFGDVLGDLAALGYDAEWDCIPASAVGAPHQRDRLWIVAYPNGERGAPERGQRPLASGEGASWRAQRGRRSGDAERQEPVRGAGQVAALADADSSRLEGHGRLRVYGEGAGERLARARCRAIENQWGAEPDVGRVANGVPARVDRLRALGNAVVPQIPEFIATRLNEIEHSLDIAA